MYIRISHCIFLCTTQTWLPCLRLSLLLFPSSPLHQQHSNLWQTWRHPCQRNEEAPPNHLQHLATLTSSTRSLFHHRFYRLCIWEFISYFHYAFLYLQTLLKSHTFISLVHPVCMHLSRIKNLYCCPRSYKAAIYWANEPRPHVLPRFQVAYICGKESRPLKKKTRVIQRIIKTKRSR